MAAALEETPVSYEDLADIEVEFDEVETEIIRQQITLTTPLYTKRSNITSQIPNFWPLVLEQAPPDIDQYIQPSDSALLLSSLLSLSVSNFEVSPDSTLDSTGGDPRSVAIKFEFSANDYLEDKVLEKKFYWRRSRDGWSGLVSEPVPIAWKEGRDLTGGLLNLVVKAWEAENALSDEKNGKAKGLSPEQKALKKKIDNTGMGGLSFFAWFGFIGRRVTVEESREAIAREKAKRDARRRGEKVREEESEDGSEEEEDEEGKDDLGMSLEIFPDGDDLAVAISEDLWPGAIKYFTQAQEQDALSDADFESDDEEMDDEPEHSAAESSDNEADVRPAKKRKS